jgi:hypothetical protein
LSFTLAVLATIGITASISSNAASLRGFVM